MILCNFIIATVLFPWLVYYGDAKVETSLQPYNPIVFDHTTHPPLKPLLQEDKELLGYISLGEVDEYNEWFDEVKNAGLLIKKNKNWPGSWAIDLRNPLWKDLLLKKILPSIFAQGFTGLFYDQLDISIDLEQKEPEKYNGMIKAAIDLVKSIKKANPDKRIMINRAYEILPDVGNEVDYLLAEDLFTTYDFDKKKYLKMKDSDVEWQLSHINNARARFPHLVVFSLDYWAPDDTREIKKLYARARKECIRPYVSTIELNKVIPEPTNDSFYTRFFKWLGVIYRL